ncbi:hypothetical protein BC670_1122 [Flavobacterium branchiophilum]|uniref:Uncharacterized protein n=1 Tax=Flavobacterium branchiophilum TaxID=55197 RepID=A0A543G2I2_9FLAO|nr:hypothetical protein BC670_1122 [Flavobacterium branchiophilum]
MKIIRFKRYFLKTRSYFSKQRKHDFKEKSVTLRHNLIDNYNEE